LKTADVLSKDSKYRGKSTSRKDLFEDSQTLVEFREPAEFSADDSGEDEQFSRPSSNEPPDEISDTSSISSENDASETESEDGENNEQLNRRDKVRKLLAQENMYPFLARDI
jgi:hypothetical protein